MNVGGAEAVLMNLARNLTKEEICNMDFLVFGNEVGDYEAELTNLGSRILRMPPPSISRPISFQRYLRKILRKYGPYEVVHSHINFASGLVLRAARLEGVSKRLAHSHMSMYEESGILRTSYARISQMLILRNATDLTACGNEAGQFLFGSAWNERGLMIPNAIDVELFQQAACTSRDQLRQDLGIGSKTLIIGTVARLVPIKNLRFLIEVLRTSEQLDTPMHLVIAGEGPERDAITAYADQLGVNEHVTMLGLRRDIPDLMAGFDVLAMPSIQEGLPVSLIEAQASGLPAVVSTGVTKQASLVPGLVHFESTDSPSRWVDAIAAQIKIRVDPSVVRSHLHAAGYTVESQVNTMRYLYGWA